ncbi:MAG: hypothetical protein BRC47_03580 [Cyanobacteria bacterium QS_7_48_42]|nr:MAG: hypothetical protein BRC47_03580 [Cyanobacteria bacterium QS_7_48_42]
MKVCFLLDENLSPRFKTAVLRLNSEIDILRVGDANVPPFGTPDADLLHYLELSQRLLVTDNRESMPEHLREHWAEGGHIWGLFWVHPHLSTGRLAQELVMVWETSEAEEWMEITDWIPF